MASLSRQAVEGVMQRALLHANAGVVVATATLAAMVGAAFGTAITLWRQGGPLGDPPDDNLPAFILENMWALSGIALGGGIGWFIGAFVGSHLRHTATPGTAIGTWLLRVLAFGVGGAALLSVNAIPTGTPQVGSDTFLGYDGTPLRILLALGSALAVGTLAVISLPLRQIPRSALLSGAVVLLVAALVFSAVPGPETAWLRHWLSTRQGRHGAAADLITPAPVDCPARLAPLDDDDQRSFDSDMPYVTYWINPFAPRWLPEGFGLALDRSWPTPKPHAIWTDSVCREVALDVRWGSTAKRHGAPAATGMWSPATPSWCEDGSWRCREYRVEATVRGSRDTTALVIRTVGLAPDEVERIIHSIPTRRVVYE